MRAKAGFHSLRCPKSFRRSGRRLPQRKSRKRHAKRPFAFSSRSLPSSRYVSRFVNATSAARGLAQTFTNWQLSQLWYSRRAGSVADAPG